MKETLAVGMKSLGTAVVQHSQEESQESTGSQQSQVSLENLGSHVVERGVGSQKEAEGGERGGPEEQGEEP